MAAALMQRALSRAHRAHGVAWLAASTESSYVVFAELDYTYIL